ncbi:alpha-L-rhamnosidase C-terminal domain-containing protein [Pedobacter aquatilis]|uniref:alpha-L-rhamnosidase C-terminal domain-containing protein n=1 Tax=Pedobacter aquatilis TaxID=351343 RepID=UPI003977D594
MKTTELGFRSVEISPVIDARIKFVQVKFRSHRGVIGVKCKVVGKKVTMDIQVPMKVSAVYEIPVNLNSDRHAITLHPGKQKFSFYLNPQYSHRLTQHNCFSKILQIIQYKFIFLS